MTTMTESEMEDHIASNNWIYVETKLLGTEAYKSSIGIYRIMFGLTDDPKAVNTLLARNKTEVWTLNENNWEQVFPC